MSLWKIISLLQLMILFPFQNALMAQAEELRREIGKIIKYEQSIDFNVVPGVLIGVIDGDNTFRFVLGRDIDPDGIFELGSITKPVVALLGNDALETLNMDRFAPVCSFIPDSLCNDAWQSLTYDQIIEHKTGLVRLPPGIGEIETDVQDPYKDYTLQQFASDLQEMNPVPGMYSYSHIGYALTQWLFEKAGGLEKFTHDQLARFYDMDSTRWDFPADEIAQGHGLDGRQQPVWNTNALKPAIGLKSTMSDMIAFVNILFDGYEKNRLRRDPDNLKKELRVLRKTGAYKVVDGWFVVRAGKSLVYYHNGRTGGHHVSVAFTPHLRKGVIVISNGAMGSNELSLLILRMVNQAEKIQKRMRNKKA